MAVSQKYWKQQQMHKTTASTKGDQEAATVLACIEVFHDKTFHL